MKKFVLWSLLILLLVLAGVIGTQVASRKITASQATKKGNDFVRKLYAEYTIAGSSCQGDDTDGDSYVSCDFRLVSPQNEERVVHLQCPILSKSILGDVCKESRLSIPQ